MSRCSASWRSIRSILARTRRSAEWRWRAAVGPEAVRAFRVALAAGPLDRASAHADLAEGLLQTGNKAEARREALAALEIAPTYERAQDLLLKVTDGARH